MQLLVFLKTKFRILKGAAIAIIILELVALSGIVVWRQGLMAILCPVALLIGLAACWVCGRFLKPQNY